MRFIFAILAFYFGCSNVSAQSAADRPGIAEVATQHTYLLSFAAWFFCEHGRWPDNLPELFNYRVEKRILLDVKIYDAWLMSTEVTYGNKPKYGIRSHSFHQKDGWLDVSSIQAMPKCGKNETELQEAHIDARVPPN